MNPTAHGPDPFDDLFADGEYEPSLAFAVTAAQQAKTYAERAQAFVAHQRPVRLLRNAIAASARKSMGVQLAALMAFSQSAQTFARQALATTEDGQPELVTKAVDAYGQCVKAYDGLLMTVQHLDRPDPPMPIAEPEPLPQTQDAATVAGLARAEALAWIRSARGQTGKFCVMRNSPGIGKTETMIDAALAEQLNGQRVIFGVRTKSMIKGNDPELVRRIEGKTYLTIRKHVITGRDDENCRNFKNVEAVQRHGYASGRTVCLGCEHHPKNAPIVGLPICEYYATRIRAQLDSIAARKGAHATYPLILTVHAAVKAAFDTGGGEYGKFWAADLILIDEDPTETFEFATILRADQTLYTSTETENQATVAFARVCQEAVRLADHERKLSRGVGFVVDGKRPSPIHRTGTSEYCAESLHNLLERARTTVAQTTRVPNLRDLSRDVVEAGKFTTEPGRLFGATSAAALNFIVPPVSLSRVAGSLRDEIGNVDAIRRHAYHLVRGSSPSRDITTGGDIAAIQAEIEAHTAIPDFAYATRLEWSNGDWQFVAQEAAPLRNHVANIVIGDAYAQVEHYEQLFGRKCDKLIDYVAHFPPGTKVIRTITKSGIGHLEKGFLQQNLALLETYLQAEGPGKRVLVYGHGEKLRDKVEPWLAEMAVKYQLKDWAFEHWWGGRGKDHYNGWDVYLQVSEPIQNIGGMLHTVNARAFRNAVRAKTHEERMAFSERICFDLNDGYPTLAHAMRDAHKELWREHERQNINEQTQAINRLRPIWNEVHCYVLSADVELSRDLLAATESVVPADSRKTNLSVSQRRDKGTRTESVVDAYITPHETLEAILATMEWFGVWSPLFAHALVTVPVPVEAESDLAETVPSQDGLSRLRPNTSPAQLRISSRAQEVFGLSRSTGTPDAAPVPPRLHPADPLARSADSAVRRVWNPPVYWARLGELARRVKGIQTATQILQAKYLAVRPDRWAAWRGNGPGQKPLVYYSPDHPMYGGLDRPDLALRAFHAIIDNQYGPTQNGKLIAPNADHRLPGSWMKVPF